MKDVSLKILQLYLIEKQLKKNLDYYNKLNLPDNFYLFKLRGHFFTPCKTHVLHPLFMAPK